MRIGWLAAELGIPVSIGNTFLEVGVHMAAALPEVEWLEYSFQNFDHLVEQPIDIRDGYAGAIRLKAPDRKGRNVVPSTSSGLALGAIVGARPISSNSTEKGTGTRLVPC
ncbi:hypothetical protein [Mesorhizobium loti]